LADPSLRFGIVAGGCRPDSRYFGDDGAQGRDRTADTAIFSRMLYQLSYLGPRFSAGRHRERRVT
jgi:hypothetical protein